MALLSSCTPRAVAEPFATGLNQPRGMVFDDSGDLFVAEAGAEFSAPTNHSGRVLRITPNREVTVVVDGLPFTNLGEHGDVGATDLAMLDGALYLLTGEGYDVLSRSVLRVVPGGPLQPVASIRNFAAAGLSRDLLETGLVAANLVCHGRSTRWQYAICGRWRVGARTARGAGWEDQRIRRAARYATADRTGVRPRWKIVCRRF